MKMLRSLLPTARRVLPTVAKVSALALGLWTVGDKGVMGYLPFSLAGVQCFHGSMGENSMGEVLSRVIRVELNGEFVGYAYCFRGQVLVSASVGILDSSKHSEDFEYFLGERKMETCFKVMGTFENLTFIHAQEDIVPVLPSHLDPPTITPVHVVQKRHHLSIKDGYYVTDDAGYGIVDGKGEVNSLVIDSQGVVGVITQVGRDNDRGFLRMIKWGDISQLAAKLKSSHGAIQEAYLGLSVKASEGQDGLIVVRVASDSPFRGKVEMGDLLSLVNRHTVREPGDIIRVISMAGQKICLDVKNSTGENRKVEIMI